MSVSMARPSLPLIAPLGRAISRDINVVFYLMVIAVTLVVLAVKTWGLVALTMTALALVPLMFIFFVAISWPF